MEELRLAFLVIGALAIAGILVHGLWSVRRQNTPKKEARLEPHDWQDDYDDIEDVDLQEDDDVIELASQKRSQRVEPNMSSDGADYDELGVGAVRIVSQRTSAGESTQHDDESSKQQEESISSSNKNQAAPDLDMSKDADSVSVVPPVSKPKIYSSVVTQPKPEYAAQQVQAMRSKVSASDSDTSSEIPEPPPFLLKTGVDSDTASVSSKQTTDSKTTSDKAEQNKPSDPSDVASSSKSTDTDSTPVAQQPTTSQSAKVSLAEQARSFVKRNKAEAKPRKRREPKIGDDQMRIDFDEPEQNVQSEPISAEPNKTEAASNAEAQQQEVLVLNVKAAEDKPIQGSALLPMLLTLGFKFGDQDIFHRHVNSNGKGPVLFSLANMFKPGVFDIDNLENFTTMGVSLFMMLPIEGDPHQVFNMMHNAARKIADEFSAQVLDGRRSALTKQSLQQYVEKIREFERKRMISKQ